MASATSTASSGDSVDRSCVVGLDPHQPGFDAVDVLDRASV